ncbi:MAG: hypothetical protein NC489_11105 [Ruminococcus flavefaciens]|nr:hypothetical protein [Ruminococcus flavefaciens]
MNKKERETHGASSPSSLLLDFDDLVGELSISNGINMIPNIHDHRNPIEFVDGEVVKELLYLIIESKGHTYVGPSIFKSYRNLFFTEFKRTSKFLKMLDAGDK